MTLASDTPLGYNQTWEGILERFNTHEEKLCALKNSHEEEICALKRSHDEEILQIEHLFGPQLGLL